MYGLPRARVKQGQVQSTHAPPHGKWGQEHCAGICRRGAVVPTMMDLSLGHTHTCDGVSNWADSTGPSLWPFFPLPAYGIAELPSSATHRIRWWPESHTRTESGSTHTPRGCMSVVLGAKRPTHQPALLPELPLPISSSRSTLLPVSATSTAALACFLSSSGASDALRAAASGSSQTDDGARKRALPARPSTSPGLYCLLTVLTTYCNIPAERRCAPPPGPPREGESWEPSGGCMPLEEQVPQT